MWGFAESPISDFFHHRNVRYIHKHKHFSQDHKWQYMSVWIIFLKHNFCCADSNTMYRALVVVGTCLLHFNYRMTDTLSKNVTYAPRASLLCLWWWQHWMHWQSWTRRPGWFQLLLQQTPKKYSTKHVRPYETVCHTINMSRRRIRGKVQLIATMVNTSDKQCIEFLYSLARHCGAEIPSSLGCLLLGYRS